MLLTNKFFTWKKKIIPDFTHDYFYYYNNNIMYTFWCHFKNYRKTILYVYVALMIVSWCQVVCTAYLNRNKNILKRLIYSRMSLLP